MNDDAFDTAAFGLQPGETSDVVALASGAAILQVEDRQADRAYTDTQLRAVQDRALEDWYNAQRDSDAVERSWDSTMVPASQ